MTGKPVSPLRFGSVDFTRWRLPGFLSESVEKHEGVIAPEEKQNPIAVGTQFPDAIGEMLCVGVAEAGAVKPEQLNVMGKLLVLNPGIAVRG